MRSALQGVRQMVPVPLSPPIRHPGPSTKSAFSGTPACYTFLLTEGRWSAMSTRCRWSIQPSRRCSTAAATTVTSIRPGFESKRARIVSSLPEHGGCPVPDFADSAALLALLAMAFRKKPTPCASEAFSSGNSPALSGPTKDARFARRVGGMRRERPLSRATSVAAGWMTSQLPDQLPGSFTRRSRD